MSHGIRLFGTDGIRGRVNKSPMTPENVLRIGMAVASVLKDDHGRNMVLIGKDTRLSGYMIESALTSGICSMGMNVTLVGPIPTPGIAFLTRTLRLDAGIVISASHNPFGDNGIKIFSSAGFKLSGDIEGKIEQLVADEDFPAKRPTNEKVGKAYRLDDAVGRYIEYIKSTIPREIDLEGLRVVVDTANGAAYKVTPILLRELGAEVISINDRPDGININDNCGSLHIDCLVDAVKKNNAHIGIAHDGDADRTLFVDEKGNAVDGDMILGMWAPEMKKEGKLKGNGVVATVMTNLGIERYLSLKGIKLIRTKVGDRYVVEEMKKGGYNFGGEQSGHIIFFDYNTTGDGPVTALQVLYLMRKKNRLISELTSDIELYPQVLLNVHVSGERVKGKDIKESPEITKVIEHATRKLGDKGRILVRPSGTEPKIRVMVEAEDGKMAKEVAEDIAEVIQNSVRGF
ncbi:phosphoglucosamine mutase [Dissulfurispira thermophila]|uniref:Phosphoglucosamine mutase n=2 Tax=root TaxID=1 RepID=A0A7G1H4T7_9BACT|nr:phosphoglucosamine mutase [Dissulfurispira thermophila]BCB97239.1 phosphoglucosamine mutase [Dissulfurispira thermophila]